MAEVSWLDCRLNIGSWLNINCRLNISCWCLSVAAHHCLQPIVTDRVIITTITTITTIITITTITATIIMMD